MSITIYGAIASPHNIPNGSETTVKISFKGRVLNDNTKVEVDFTISPFPALSFKGAKSVSEDFVFSKTIKTYTKTVVIVNKKDPAAKNWLSDGRIRLDATEINTSNVDTTYTAIQYK